MSERTESTYVWRRINRAKLPLILDDDGDWVANGTTIEWCIEHAASMIGNRGGCGYDSFTPCRPVPRILIDPASTPQGDTK